ncbi:hypothetical protein CEXT_176171 [Caerostris extrusa]|uniref:Uncharacterized protein n=1 Tax=Caerostris extrusa TaxID=172846 RepID=A0AAV4USG6_CAEEX|nr:hypothetical protein CEXT_176171 [Caerostris extrusa]
MIFQSEFEPINLSAFLSKISHAKTEHKQPGKLKPPTQRRNSIRLVCLVVGAADQIPRQLASRYDDSKKTTNRCSSHFHFCPPAFHVEISESLPLCHSNASGDAPAKRRLPNWRLDLSDDFFAQPPSVVGRSLSSYSCEREEFENFRFTPFHEKSTHEKGLGKVGRGKEIVWDSDTKSNFPRNRNRLGRWKSFFEFLREILRGLSGRKTAAKKSSGRSNEKEDLKFK